jgi:tetratricopeptide (TPR) repeat protein
MTTAAGGNNMQLRAQLEQAFQVASGLHNEGRLGDADKLYQFILAVMPSHYGALFRLGVLRARANRMEAAVRLLCRAVAVNPQSVDAYGVLGLALSALDCTQEAIACYKKALSVDPNHAATLNALGTILHKAGQNGQAIDCLERAIAIKPDYADAHFTLANILQGLDRLRDAMEHYHKVVAIEPRNYAAHSNLGTLLQKLGHFDNAITLYKYALAINPDFVDACYNLGTAYLALDRNEEAIEQNEKALRIDPSRALAHNNIGVALQALGRIDEAGQAYERALEIAPRHAMTHLNLAYLRRFTAGDPRLAALENLAEDMAAYDTDSRIALHFALGKAFCDLGQHERSFGHLREGNALKRAQLTYNEKDTLSLLERIQAIFTPGLMGQNCGSGDPSDAPVFVVGMPRSGTTLVEQILASHSEVHGAGEIEAFYQAMLRSRQRNGVAAPFPDLVPTIARDALRELGSDYVQSIMSLAPAAGRIVNKLPLNFKYVGLIHLALPNARIIHVRRDPMDTCFSCFSLLFSGNQSFAYDLGELARYFRGYEALMDHWHSVLPQGVMMEVRYEDLVADLDGLARAIVDHCGLPWEDACLAFHETRRPVRTASSVQVRNPVYRTSVGRWRPYERFLQPLMEALNPTTPGGTGTSRTDSSLLETPVPGTG